MLLSRAKPAAGQEARKTSARNKNQIAELEDFIKIRDFSGAIALLEYQRGSEGKDAAVTDLWLAYCYFHSGEFAAAAKIYQSIIASGNLPRRKNSGNPPEEKRKSIAEGALALFKGQRSSEANEPPPANNVSVTNDDLLLYLACCQFFLGMYKEASESVQKVGIRNSLRTRLELHLAHKSGNESLLMEHHQKLKDVLEDQLCLASIHYLRAHYQEAIDIYKKILVENRTFIALNVFVALCYYKLDYYDVSQEVLAVYLNSFPDSVTAMNIKSCNHYRLYNGKAAETELRTLIDSASSSFTFAKDIIRHNLVVFRSGEGSLQVFPSLLDVLPEARLNLVIYYLKNDQIDEAAELMKDVEPSVPHEYIVKAVVNAVQGQETGNRESLKVAQQYYQLVGGSASECDTIPGRQSMASCFFIMKQFDDVLLYLSSIKSYFYNDDAFNFNYAQAKAATGSFKEAEEIFVNIQNDKIKKDFVYISWLTRCYIMNKKAEDAWNMYTSVESSAHGFNLLNLMANDCYKMGLFIDSLKAFNLLEKIEANSEYWEGKRGAACGHFQMVVAGKETVETLNEVIRILRSSKNNQVDHIIAVMKKWMAENGTTSKFAA